MRLLRRTELRFHSQVHLHACARKPAPATLGKLGRFRDLSHPQRANIETACNLLLAHRHGKLDVIDGSKLLDQHETILSETMTSPGPPPPSHPINQLSPVLADVLLKYHLH